MFSNLSEEAPESAADYPLTDSSLPFAEYIQQCQQMIINRREDTFPHAADKQTIIQANSPFELAPERKTNKPIKVGVLLIHGLLDCPFTYREISSHLQQQDYLLRAILLPGHGTRPSDLLHVTYQEWLQAVRYGIESLKNEVEHLYLVGYSTGAALSIYHALQDSRINGLVLLSPAIKIPTHVDIGAKWIHLTNCLGKDRDWIFHGEENDYTKYRSVAFNGLKQVTRLSDSIRGMGREHPVQQPMLMILSREDETISSKEAIDFFSAMRHPRSEMILYSASTETYSDTRIEIRKSSYPELNISHFSHISLPFSATNPHYGQHGDFPEASILKPDQYIDGAYNRIEANAFDLMAKYHLVQHTRRVLTYNPDFSHMMNRMTQFITDTMK